MLVSAEVAIGFVGALVGVLVMVLYKYVHRLIVSSSESAVESSNVERNCKRIITLEEDKVDKKVCKLKHDNINDNLRHLRNQVDEVKDTVNKIYEMNGGGK